VSCDHALFFLLSHRLERKCNVVGSLDFVCRLIVTLKITGVDDRK